MDLSELPTEVLEKIFNNLEYKEVARMRQVCRTFDNVCQQTLNSSFLLLRQEVCIQLSDLKKKKLVDKSYALANAISKWDIIHTRVALLEITIGVCIERELCCFFPGEILDEMRHILHYYRTNNAFPEITPLARREVLFDKLRKAMAFVNEYISSWAVELNNCNNNSFSLKMWFNCAPEGYFYSWNSVPYSTGIIHMTPALTGKMLSLCCNHRHYSAMQYHGEWLNRSVVLPEVPNRGPPQRHVPTGTSRRYSDNSHLANHISLPEWWWE